MFSLFRYGVVKQQERFTIAHKGSSSLWEFIDHSQIGEKFSFDEGGHMFLYLQHHDNGKIEFDLQVIFELVEAKTRKVLRRKKPLIILAADSSTDPHRSVINKYLSSEFHWQMIIFTRDAEIPYQISGPSAEVLKNWKNLFINRESSADVAVQASDGVIIHVHKLILTTQSSVFNTMFEIDMTEKESSIVKIEDFDSKVLIELFRFMYCGEAHTNVEINTELLRAAKRYEVTGLSKLCENYIIETFEGIDIWPVLEISHTFEMQKLFEFIASIFFVNYKLYSEQPEWKDQKDMTLTLKIYKFIHMLNEKETKKHWEL